MSSDSAPATAAPISIAIVEDNAVYRELLCDICRRSAHLTLLAAYSSVQEAREHLAALDADIVLVDLGLPDGEGAEVIGHLRRLRCRGECLVLTVYDDDRHLFPALAAGAIGYVLKEQTDEATLVAAILEAVRGGAPMSASIARRVLSSFRDKPTPGVASSTVLTARENEIMEQLALGHSARKVAQLLQISYHTIRCHQKNIYKKLHVKSVLEALAVLKRATASRDVESDPSY
jgi:DNA-binding NarL/FixJ family response regulator